MILSVFDQRGPIKVQKAAEDLALLILWRIWQERNECTFRAKIASVSGIIVVRRNFELWCQASVKFIEPPFGDESARI